MILTWYYIIITFVLSTALWMGITTIVIKRINSKIKELQNTVKPLAQNPSLLRKKRMKNTR
mgnify:CR=1 FL=1|jgi:uncharacterized protein involved in cysteine biosynthesis